MKKRFEELKKKIDSLEFYHNRGLANEIPFYIFDYSPREEEEIRYFVKEELVPYFKNHENISMVEVDIFDLMIKSLEDEGILEAAFEMEGDRGTEYLYEKIKLSFNPKIASEYIEELSESNNLVLITGVGKAFPIVRTHAILNNLQSIFDHKKVILFFPGEYTGRDLRLFGFKDNNYYRAFKI